jgi:hypothetical protein
MVDTAQKRQTPYLAYRILDDVLPYLERTSEFVSMIYTGECATPVSVIESHLIYYFTGSASMTSSAHCFACCVGCITTDNLAQTIEALSNARPA